MSEHRAIRKTVDELLDFAEGLSDVIDSKHIRAVVGLVDILDRRVRDLEADLVAMEARAIAAETLCDRVM